MPANRKNALIGKQNRLIATRLLQISLLVDDYVYQHKPMSQRSAATYINEISAYKDKCYRDVRSLQVIEKLTRCMNEIILEQQGLNGEYGEDNRVVPFQEISQDNEPTLSPVYSNPDEDLTQIPVDTSIHDRETDLNNKDEIETRQVTMEKVKNNVMEDIGTDFNKTIRYFNDGANVTSTEYPLNNEMEVIDLSDDVVDLIYPGDDIFHHEPELNIQNAVSNLSLRDVDETFTPLSLGCSQSILDTYYSTTSDTEYTIQQDVALTNVTSYVTIAPQKPVTNIVENNITKIVLPTNKKIVQTPITNGPTQITQVMKNALNDTQTAKASEQKTKKRNVRKKSKTKLPTVETNISRAVKKTAAKAGNKKQNIKANETKPLKHEIANKIYTNPTQIVSTHSDQGDHQCPNTEDPLTNSTTQLNLKQITDKRCRNDTLPIYNNSVVNDLSWVENLRFVREISSKEYESFTEDQVFWDNYSLPSQWNEADFNY